jgi:hypothetical protein
MGVVARLASLLVLCTATLLVPRWVASDDKDDALAATERELERVKALLAEEQLAHVTTVTQLQAEVADLVRRLEEGREQLTAALREAEARAQELRRVHRESSVSRQTLQAALEVSEAFGAALAMRIDRALAAPAESARAALRPEPLAVEGTLLPAPRADEPWVVARARFALGRDVSLEWETAPASAGLDWIRIVLGVPLRLTPAAQEILADAEYTALSLSKAPAAKVVPLLVEALGLAVRWHDGGLLLDAPPR